ncbi:MAG: ABC transporter ATP-binding protein [Candidatus Marinimicrobia bacterium]|nr:ABC transporter ATP-binding protein [Candidatus Neomarinimicrobiota bacterium]MBL7110235.1 ABC transporter ATP-binding protein [Candidatus Neomarinimicrobiota bacterium]
MKEKAQKETEYTKRFDFAVWKKILKFAIPYRKFMVYLALAMMSVAGVDIVMPMLTRYVIDNIVATGEMNRIVPFAILFLSIILLQSFNVFFFIVMAGKVETGVSYAIRNSAFSKLQDLSFSYFDKTPVGWLMARMTSDTTKLSNIIAWGLVDFVWGFTLMFGIAIAMFIVNWKLALVVLSVTPILAWISGKFQVRILKSYRTVRKTNSKITASFNEGIMGAITTKSLVREDANYKDFSNLTTTMFQSSYRAAVQSALFLPIVLTGSIVGCALALWAGGNGVVMGVLSYGTLVMFIAYADFFFIPIRELAHIFAELQNAQASAERIMTLIETQPEIVDNLDSIKEHPLKVNGEVEFEDVGFKYKNGQEVLANFNLKVKAGETIAFVGDTGGGKTTIANLVGRFYEPTSGKILVDGIDYTKLPLQWIQSNLGVVLQEPHLFSGTIIENIRYGNLNASDDEAISASKLAHSHQFIEDLELGYQTIIEEGGTNLSTGQKQLLSLARALLANPAILIMDEATSSVDTETEHLIQQAIQTVVVNRTSFIIAHRLSTIRNADRILVIQNGKIVEEGDHDELLRQKGKYYNLYSVQFVDEITSENLRNR